MAMMLARLDNVQGNIEAFIQHAIDIDTRAGQPSSPVWCAAWPRRNLPVSPFKFLSVETLVSDSDAVQQLLCAMSISSDMAMLS